MTDKKNPKTDANVNPAVKEFVKEKLGSIRARANEAKDVDEKLDTLHQGGRYLNGAADFGAAMGMNEAELSLFDAGLNVLTKQTDAIEADLQAESLLA